MLEGAGAIVNLPLPGAEPARVLLELQKGPEYVTFLQESIAEAKQILGADMVGNAVDINALGTIGTDAEGKKRFLPSVNLMTLAMLANNLGPNFKITVFSIAGLDKSLTAEEMRNLLGPYASIFADIMQAADVGQVVSTIRDNQKIPEEKIVVTVAQSTLQRALREGIDIYKNLTAAVKRIMIKQPTMAVASYKALLIDTLKFLKGALPPSQIEALRQDIQNAPDSMLENTLIVEPKGEEHETEVSSRQQAAVAV
jgi:hypothetical protein